MEDKKEIKEALSSIEKLNTSRRAFLKGAAAVTAGGAFALWGYKGAKPAQAAEQPKPVYNHLFAFRENCTGCRACEYACSMQHEKAIRPSVSRIYTTRYRDIIDVTSICWQCDDTPCIKACPTTPVAIKLDPKTKAIKFIDDKTCLGAKCNKCIEACPSKFLRRHPDTGWPLFCDMCDGDPECVKACAEYAGDPVAQCLRAEKLGFGVNMAFKEVDYEEASKYLLMNFFYPSKDGERR